MHASYIDCCISHSNGTRDGPDLVCGGGACGCSYMLLVQPTPTCTNAGRDLASATCNGGVFLPATGANTPLALMQLALRVVVVCGSACMWWWWL